MRRSPDITATSKRSRTSSAKGITNTVTSVESTVSRTQIREHLTKYDNRYSTLPQPHCVRNIFVGSPLEIHVLILAVLVAHDTKASCPPHRHHHVNHQYPCKLHQCLDAVSEHPQPKTSHADRGIERADKDLDLPSFEVKCIPRAVPPCSTCPRSQYELRTSATKYIDAANTNIH